MAFNTAVYIYEDGSFEMTLLCANKPIHEFELCTTQRHHVKKGQSEPPPTKAPWRMDGNRSLNNFLLGSSSLANHGG
jgi:hypothetical protein